MRGNESPSVTAFEPTVNPSEAITLAEAAGLFPRKNGKKIHVLTLTRWCTKGYRGIRLVGFKVGSRWFTTPEAVSRFQTECTEQAVGNSNVQTPDVRLEAARAREALTKRGFFRDRGRRFAKPK